MRRCIQIARNGLQTAKPNPAVGAVIVVPTADGGQRIIGEGYTSAYGGPHAEVNAFASVKPEDEKYLPEATIYVSLEPCSHWGHTPPCCDLIIRKGVKRVVCGCVDPFAKVQGRGIKRIREAGIDVTVGVLEKECIEFEQAVLHLQHQAAPLHYTQMGTVVGRVHRRPLASDGFLHTIHPIAGPQAPCRERRHPCRQDHRTP